MWWRQATLVVQLWSPLLWHTHTHTGQSVIPERERKGWKWWSHGAILYTIQCHYARCQSANSAEALQPWPLTQELPGWVKVISVWVWVLKAEGPDCTGTALRVRSRQRSQKQGGTFTSDQTWSNMVASHQRFWSHGRASGANSARLFARLISGVVTSGGTHRLTSVQQNYLKKTT